MPRNTESKLISSSLKMLPPEIKVVLSFADESMGHCGIIYQATNWYYCGKNKGGKMLENENGLRLHPRLIEIYRKRHPELRQASAQEIRQLLAVHEVTGGAKYRYVYLRGDKREKRKMYQQIKDRILPYPKLDTEKEKLSEKEIIEANSKFFGEMNHDLQLEFL